MLLFNNFEPPYLIGIFIAVLMGMTVHEFAHNYVAHLMGDPNPSRQGRLTLDPSVHIYWPGFIMFLLIGWGILGTAPISANRMRNPRWGYLAAVAAGPFSNLLLAVICAIPVRIILESGSVSDNIFIILYMMVFWNVLLFVFNMLPFFPIDGWHIVYALLPPDLASSWQRNAQTTQFILLGLIMLSFIGIAQLDILGEILFEPTNSIVRTLIIP